MKRVYPALIFVAIGLSACGKSSANPACGITALAGATMLLDQFSVPEQTLTSTPRTVPTVLPVRLAAGPAWRGLVTAAADSTWVVRVEGRLPAQIKPGFGVLVVSTNGTASGVMLYTGPPVARAPKVGSVTADTLTIPLLALQTNVSGLEDPACPFFPDSLARP
ncbi:MAG TPA: hypothetical protein VJU15_10425 [Gemmatimonadales bacterium]|nr:hypothetical protein [Gemmatimonadales bacterium]